MTSQHEVTAGRPIATNDKRRGRVGAEKAESGEKKERGDTERSGPSAHMAALSRDKASSIKSVSKRWGPARSALMCVCAGLGWTAPHRNRAPDRGPVPLRLLSQEFFLGWALGGCLFLFCVVFF